MYIKIPLNVAFLWKQIRKRWKEMQSALPCLHSGVWRQNLARDSREKILSRTKVCRELNTRRYERDPCSSQCQKKSKRCIHVISLDFKGCPWCEALFHHIRIGLQNLLMRNVGYENHKPYLYPVTNSVPEFFCLVGKGSEDSKLLLLLSYYVIMYNNSSKRMEVIYHWKAT